jgi:hypothetical protein
MWATLIQSMVDNLGKQPRSAFQIAILLYAAYATQQWHSETTAHQQTLRDFISDGKEVVSSQRRTMELQDSMLAHKERLYQNLILTNRSIMAHNANAIAALLAVCTTSLSGIEAPTSNAGLLRRKVDIIRTIDSNRYPFGEVHLS